MEKLSFFFDFVKNTSRKIYREYIGTILAGIIVSFVMIFENMSEKDHYDFTSHFYLVMMIFMIGSFFVENVFFSKRQTEKVTPMFYGIYYGICLFIGIVIDGIAKIMTDNEASSYVIYYFEATVIFMLTALFVISIYSIIRRRNICFQTYILRVTFGLIFTWGIIIVLLIAILIILGIFSVLIMHISFDEFLVNVMLFFGSTIILPFTINVITNPVNDVSKKTKNLILFILIPCLMITFVIVYMYIFKIIILSQGIIITRVFRICALTFVIGAPIWTMAQGFLSMEEEGWFYKIIKYMKYYYAPLILLEIYANGSNIHSYGLTENRYMGIMFVLFQITYVLFEFILLFVYKMKKKKTTFKEIYGKKYELLLFSFLTLLFISLLCPGINCQRACFISQKNRLEENINSNPKEAAGALKYLHWDDIYGQPYLEENYSDEVIQNLLLFSYENNGEEQDIWTYSSMSKDAFSNGINIAGYSKIYRFNFWDSDINDYSHIDIHYSDGIVEDVEITDILTELILQMDDNYSSRDKFDGYYIPTTNGCVYIYNIHFKYSTSGKIKNLSIDGYYLEK